MKGTKSKSLFDDPSDDFRPAENRPDPVVWIRRLAIVESPRPDAVVIREIRFRRGLNIIATALPKASDGPVGHNVGKTLLTRLVRYSLGEAYFAREQVRAILAKRLPAAYVAAEVFVAGTWWAVARPIGEAGAHESWCLRATDWHAAFANPTDAIPYGEFITALQAATVAGFSRTILPHQGRPARWLDVLAWLSRDQFCRYRDPLEWRNAATDSGTGELHTEDASILIRLVMDLLDDDERKLIRKHKRLLSKKSERASKLRDIGQDISTTRRFLGRRLRITEDLLTDDLFGRKAARRAKQQQERLRQKIESLPAKSGLANERATVESLRDAATRASNELDLRNSDRQTMEAEISQHQSASDEDFAESFADLATPTCPLHETACPLNSPEQAVGQRNPLREALIQQMSTDLQRLDQTLAQLRSQLEAANSRYADAKRTLDRREVAVDKERRRLSTKLARLDAVLRETTGFTSAVKEMGNQAKSLAKIERKVEDSRESNRSARGAIARKKKTLEAHFNHLLSALLGPTFQGKIDISMKGLRVAIDEQDSLPGEAMATSGTVHSLDLACLRASIGGLGFMPRLLIHDSPREGDLEPHIYAKLFEFAVELEKAFGRAEPSFQYIVATTTPAPAAIARDPFVRLTLDAREPDGLLLKRRF